MPSIRYFDDSDTEITKNEYDYLTNKTKIDQVESRLTGRRLQVVQALGRKGKLNIDGLKAEVAGSNPSELRNICEELTRDGVLQQYDFRSGTKWTFSGLGVIIGRRQP